ncbi:carbohydrate sulfotransferase 15-like [Salvelinus alpinus]|uniref:carbohydrate sulfotransferase 15-like n=1 Tax=Salvelinus alpinus TaxID=8036 RepID=UPI0039FCA5D2
MTHMDYEYTLLCSSTEDYRKRPLKLQVDDSPMSLFAVLEVKRDPIHLHRPWCTLGCGTSTLTCFRKVKLYSFLFGLTVMFLIMASYILTGDKKGLLLTPSPYHFSTVPNSGSGAGPYPFNVSSAKDYAPIKLVVKTIASKVEFSTTRQLPERKALIHSEPHMFSVIPHKFLPNVKNPCWYEEHTGNVTRDPYRKNLYARYSRRFRTVFEYLRKAFREHVYRRGGKHYRMRCLPYFYIIGQPKCGTTDLYDRLQLHPEVRFTTFKEPHWWTRKRFGIIRLSEGFHDRYPVEDYLDLFDLAAYQIQDSLMGNAHSGAPEQHNIIIELVDVVPLPNGHLNPMHVGI